MKKLFLLLCIGIGIGIRGNIKRKCVMKKDGAYHCMTWMVCF